MKVYSVCILGFVLLVEAYLVNGQAGELAAAAAVKAVVRPSLPPIYPNIDREKPIFQPSVHPIYPKIDHEKLPGVVGDVEYRRQPGGDWMAKGGAGIGVRVYEKGGHSFGVGAGYSQAGGRYQGHSWKSRPDFGVGAGYQYRWGK